MLIDFRKIIIVVFNCAMLFVRAKYGERCLPKILKKILLKYHDIVFRFVGERVREKVIMCNWQCYLWVAPSTSVVRCPNARTTGYARGRCASFYRA